MNPKFYFCLLFIDIVFCFWRVIVHVNSLQERTWQVRHSHPPRYYSALLFVFFSIIPWINIEITLLYTKPAKEQSLSGVISRRGKTIPFGAKDRNNNEEHNLSYNKEGTDHYQRREHLMHTSYVLTLFLLYWCHFITVVDKNILL